MESTLLCLLQNLPRLLSMRTLSPLFNNKRPSSLSMPDIMAYAPLCSSRPGSRLAIIPHRCLLHACTVSAVPVAAPAAWNERCIRCNKHKAQQSSAKVTAMDPGLVTAECHGLRRSAQTWMACRGTVGYAPARQQIIEAVRHDFAGAGNYVAVFEDLRKIYAAGQNWDFSAWSAGQRCSPCFAPCCAC